MSLIGEERKQRIIEILDVKEKVTVQELSEKLNVSTETIRRYLEQLDQDNKVKKVYGGAIRVFAREELPLMMRKGSYIEEKKRIGKRAAELVANHDVIALDEGSTPVHMIPYFAGKSNLTVITSSFAVANLLMEKKLTQQFDGNIFFLGGEVDAKHQRTTGGIAADMMDRFYVDKAFISIDGLTINNGLTCVDPEKGMLSQKIMSHAEKNIVLTDHSKIGVRSSYKIASLNEVHMVICNQAAPSEWKKHLRNTAWEVAPKI